MFSDTSRKASAVCKVVNSMGLHARPACILVRKVAEFESAVYFQGGLTWYHAKLGILMSLQKLKERNLVNTDLL